MRLAHTMIRVKDVDETIDFYTNFIGLREVRRKEIGDEALLVFLTDEAAGYVLELTANHGKTDYELGDQFGHLAFFADDLDSVVAEVERRGWWYRRSRPEVSARYIFLKDPNGYDVEILERSPDVDAGPGGGSH
jgi:lactoylglutathione lyase